MAERLRDDSRVTLRQRLGHVVFRLSKGNIGPYELQNFTMDPGLQAQFTNEGLRFLDAFYDPESDNLPDGIKRHLGSVPIGQMGEEEF